jgi:protease I
MFGTNPNLLGTNVAVLTSDMYEDLEVWFPMFRLMEDGINTSIVSMLESPRLLMGRHSFPLSSDLSAEEADPGQFDALVIPGGLAPDMLRRNEAVLDFTRSFFF